MISTEDLIILLVILVTSMFSAFSIVINKKGRKTKKSLIKDALVHMLSGTALACVGHHVVDDIIVLVGLSIVGAFVGPSVIPTLLTTILSILPSKPEEDDEVNENGEDKIKNKSKKK